MAYERRRTLPMRVPSTVVVRAPYRATLERRTKRLRQRVKDLGAEVRLLRWEQRAGWLAVVPLRYPLLPRRGLPRGNGDCRTDLSLVGRHVSNRRRGAVWCRRGCTRDVHHSGDPQ
jgi:hypothetical protein